MAVNYSTAVCITPLCCRIQCYSCKYFILLHVAVIVPTTALYHLTSTPEQYSYLQAVRSRPFSPNCNGPCEHARSGGDGQVRVLSDRLQARDPGRAHPRPTLTHRLPDRRCMCGAVHRFGDPEAPSRHRQRRHRTVSPPAARSPILPQEHGSREGRPSHTHYGRPRASPARVRSLFA